MGTLRLSPTGCDPAYPWCRRLNDISKYVKNWWERCAWMISTMLSLLWLPSWPSWEVSLSSWPSWKVSDSFSALRPSLLFSSFPWWNSWCLMADWEKILQRSCTSIYQLSWGVCPWYWLLFWGSGQAPKNYKLDPASKAHWIVMLQDEIWTCKTKQIDMKVSIQHSRIAIEGKGWIPPSNSLHGLPPPAPYNHWMEPSLRSETNKLKLKDPLLQRLCHPLVGEFVCFNVRLPQHLQKGLSVAPLHVLDHVE